MIAKDDWATWKDHPCTKAMMEELREAREDGFVEVSYGSEDKELLKLGMKIGKLNALTGLLNYSFIPIEE